VLSITNRRQQVLVGSIVCGVAVLGLLGWLIYSDLEAIKDTQKSSQTMQAKLRKAEADIDTIRDFEDRVLILRERVKEYVRILPDDTEIHEFVDKLTQFAQEAGVDLVQLDDTGAQRRVGPKSKKKEAFERVVYKLKLRSQTDSLLRFLSLFENQYRRFVRITSMKVALDRAGKTREPDPVTGVLPPPPPHAVDLELETYRYNPKQKGDKGAVAIQNESEKLASLYTEGRLSADTEDLDLAVYNFTPSPQRRDPFTDPRRRMGLENAISPSEREHQEATLDRLRTRLEELQAQIEVESAESNFVARVQLVSVNDRALAEFDQELAEVTKAETFTVPELADAYQKEVRQPFAALMESRNLTPMDAEIQLQHARGYVERMRQALEGRDYAQVVRLDGGLDAMRNDSEGIRGLKEILAEAQHLKDLAEAHLEFEAKELVFGGSVYKKKNPGDSVVIINQRAYSPGEMIEEGLVVKAITAGEVTFDFRGITVTRRTVEGIQ
jgi:Tfp pilus assembly protein PilO